jgi:2-methylcitrate dehydratase PrpD
MTPLEDIAAWAGRLRPSDIPGDQHALVRLRLLDTLGLIAAAAGEPPGRSMLQWAKAHAGAGDATIVADSSRTSPSAAALVHGTLAHARDFDDTFPDSVVHPGSVVVPAALATGEATDASFEDLSTAIVLGYEIAARLGKVAGRGFHARGFHATGVVGPIAAAAAAGYLLRADGRAMADALALATSMSSGLLAFLADGGWSKWLHTGWAAHGGIIAAELAREGFRGPRHAFEHAGGLFAAFAGGETAQALSPLTEGLGSQWLGASAAPKYYPCAHVIHPFLDAALALRRQGCGVEELRSIHCTVAPWAFPIVCVPREAKIAPQSDLEAIASLPFMLAAALADGRVDLDTLAPASIRRADIARLAARIDCESDEKLGRGFDGVLTIVGSHGEVKRYPVALAPTDAERTRHKFRSNARRLYTADAADALERGLIEGQPTAREIIRLACPM